MRPTREEQRAMLVHRFLVVSAVYLGLAEPVGGTVGASQDHPGTEGLDEVEDDRCRCRAA
jgi:hypothetical protein